MAELVGEVIVLSQLPYTGTQPRNGKAELHLSRNYKLIFIDWL
jgi:hypothetical protein